jgi:hypothetical protein
MTSPAGFAGSNNYVEYPDERFAEIVPRTGPPEGLLHITSRFT